MNGRTGATFERHTSRTTIVAGADAVGRRRSGIPTRLRRDDPIAHRPNRIPALTF